MSWCEDALHRWLAEQPWPAGLAGSRGHDAAVLPERRGRSVLCVDQCVEGVHFDATAVGGVAGAKAVLRALSDLAATAAQPVAVTFAMAAPQAIEEARLREILTAARGAAQVYGAELVAGDLSSTAGPLTLTVTALGFLVGSDDPVGRDRAIPGDLVVLSGPVGGSLASGRHLVPRPRVKAAQRLWAECGARAMMDVSDGLAWDLFRLARASRLRIALDAAAIPIHADATSAARSSGRSALDHALHDGEDHELVATVGVEHLEAARHAGWVPIGRCSEGAGLSIEQDGRTSAWRGGGWRHGAPRPRLLSRSAEATMALARRLGERLAAGTVVTLDGDLGAGKTTFVRGLASGLGIHEGVSSPTYTLMQEHGGGRLPLFHFDAYMEGREKALLADGADEFLGQDGVAVVEWAARVAAWLPEPRLAVRLGHRTPDQRTIEVEVEVGAQGEGAAAEGLRGLLAEVLGDLPEGIEVDFP